MCSLQLNGEKESQGQPVNPGPTRKMGVKTEFIFSVFTEATNVNHADGISSRVGKFYPHAVLTMVKTPVKTGLGKTPKTHMSWAKLIF